MKHDFDGEMPITSNWQSQNFTQTKKNVLFLDKLKVLLFLLFQIITIHELYYIHIFFDSVVGVHLKWKNKKKDNLLKMTVRRYSCFTVDLSVFLSSEVPLTTCQLQLTCQQIFFVYCFSYRRKKSQTSFCELSI